MASELSFTPGRMTCVRVFIRAVYTSYLILLPPDACLHRTTLRVTATRHLCGAEILSEMQGPPGWAPRLANRVVGEDQAHLFLPPVTVLGPYGQIDRAGLILNSATGGEMFMHVYGSMRRQRMANGRHRQLAILYTLL